MYVDICMYSVCMIFISKLSHLFKEAVKLTTYFHTYLFARNNTPSSSFNNSIAMKTDTFIHLSSQTDKQRLQPHKTSFLKFLPSSSSASSSPLAGIVKQRAKQLQEILKTNKKKIFFVFTHSYPPTFILVFAKQDKKKRNKNTRIS